MKNHLPRGTGQNPREVEMPTRWDRTSEEVQWGTAPFWALQDNDLPPGSFPLLRSHLLSLLLHLRKIG